MSISGAKKLENLCHANKAVWMGILNITPDSFSDGGKYNSKDSALKRALELVNNGAHILDIGGVSTKPFSEKIEPEIELKRIYESILTIKKSIPKHILISVDSFSPFVTEALAKEGLIDIINDQFSGKIEENLYYNNQINKLHNAQVSAFYQLGYIIMHMQGKPNDMQINPAYDNCGEEVYNFLKERMEFAEKQGVKYIVLDPGIGFGKSVENNLELISKDFINSLSQLNKNILIGLSRKWFLGQLHPELTEPSFRDNVTKKFEFDCISFGVKIIRSHTMPSEFQLNI